METLTLKSAIRSLDGVGEVSAKKLAKLGIRTLGDLLHHYPRRYDDYSQVMPIGRLRSGPVSVKGKLTNITQRRSRKGLAVTEAIISDGTGSVRAIWFNQPYLARSLPKGQTVYVSGNLELKYNRLSLQNPAVEPASSFRKNTARIVPIYPETKGLSSQQLRRLIATALAIELPETLPAAVRNNLLSYSDALHQIHFPSSQAKLAAARQRLAFEELFYLILAGLATKSELQAEAARQVAFHEQAAQDFTARLPFDLTDAQRKAAWQILQDLQRTVPMNRLLEGDVGSGKTVVAALAVLMAAKSSLQAAVMAPTGVLADQHLKALGELLDGFNLKIGHLSGDSKPKQRQVLLAELAAGEIDIVIGTHALLEPDVQFKALGVVVIDEQHRFGVNQRQLLKQKAGYMPHLLTMSATPIPRSLALTVYGDLDISLIDELPQNRKPVKTEVASAESRQAVYRHIERHIAGGSQVFVICPLISESDKLGVKSVEAEFKRLDNDIFKHRRLGRLHGKLSAAEKRRTMERFGRGEIDILVSTTVVEVGVDIPNATVMLIEGAERFGLAQLHQLRGRVGRGDKQAYCYLISSSAWVARERLSLLEKYHDGFSLAQKDLELRGPGEIYGQRQHGRLDLRLADLSDAAQIALARERAQTFWQEQRLEDHPVLAERVRNLMKLTSLD